MKKGKVKLNLHRVAHSALRLVTTGALYLKKLVTSRIFMNLLKVIFIKNLLDFSDDYTRSVVNSQIWHLDNDATNVRAAAATNLGIRARRLLAHGGRTIETVIPLNRYSLFEELADKLFPPMQLEFEIVLQNDDKMILQRKKGETETCIVRDHRSLRISVTLLIVHSTKLIIIIIIDNNFINVSSKIAVSH